MSTRCDVCESISRMHSCKTFPRMRWHFSAKKTRNDKSVSKRTITPLTSPFHSNTPKLVVTDVILKLHPAILKLHPVTFLEVEWGGH